MSDHDTFILGEATSGFGAFGPEDDDLHPAMNAAIRDYDLTETQYFSFSVPEHRLHGVTYLWHHPNLGLITGGAAAWIGHKRNAIAAELFDMRSFMRDDPIRHGISDFRLDNGYAVKVERPLERIRTSYVDEHRGNAIDLVYSAVAPPAMLENRKHFEQIMKVEGTVRLRGREYAVECFGIRDRSWAERRAEAPVDHQPVNWLTGTFGKDLAFNCLCSESGSPATEWYGAYDGMSRAGGLKGGWLFKDGQFRRFKQAACRIKRDGATLQPREVTLDLIDEWDQRHSIKGFIEASAPFHFWPNMIAQIGMARWHYDGRTGWGEAQEAQWTDLHHAHGADS
ncbi:hypothetical protein SAMN02927924_01971 [Sphingobium faniae]|nr:hypothetical protein SAMN02927924_01971 [Sphingobium faniae]